MIYLLILINHNYSKKHPPHFIPTAYLSQPFCNGAKITLSLSYTQEINVNFLNVNNIF